MTSHGMSHVGWASCNVCNSKKIHDRTIKHKSLASSIDGVKESGASSVTSGLSVTHNYI